MTKAAKTKTKAKATELVSFRVFYRKSTDNHKYTLDVQAKDVGTAHKLVVDSVHETDGESVRVVIDKVKVISKIA